MGLLERVSGRKMVALQSYFLLTPAHSISLDGGSEAIDNADIVL
jgi:hypothetical protein